MRARALVFLAFLSSAVLPAVAIELRLSTGMPEQLPYVHPDLRLEVSNTTQEPLLFPKNAFRVSMFLETETGWSECRPLVTAAPAPLRTPEWEEIAPKSVRAVPIPEVRCLCKDSRSMNVCREWMEQPGRFRIRAALETYAQEAQETGAAPARSVDRKLESNVLAIQVKRPAGVDAEAVNWAKGSPMIVEVLKAFPSSEYAALVWYGVVRLDNVDPVKTRSLLTRGQYPGPNSVPDPTVEGNWRSLDSEGVARWEVEWGRRVLQEHPDFPYREQVKVVVALGQMSLGEKDQGLRALRELAGNGASPAAGWSRAFLAVAPDTKEK